MRWTAAEAARSATFLRRANPSESHYLAAIRSHHKSKRSKAFERFQLDCRGRHSTIRCLGLRRLHFVRAYHDGFVVAARPDASARASAVRETDVAIRKETLILRHSREVDVDASLRSRFIAPTFPLHRPSSTSSLRANLAQGCHVPSPRIQSMATASKSSGKKTRRKTTAASKRSATRTKSAAKTATGPKRKSSPKVAARSGTRKSAAKRTGTRAARKQSPVTRIKRVATTVFHQGATAAKQGVQAVADLVENVKDRVTT